MLYCSKEGVEIEAWTFADLATHRSGLHEERGRASGADPPGPVRTYVVHILHIG